MQTSKSKDKELDSLKRKVNRVLDKCDRIGYNLSDLDIGAIKNIAHAESMNDVTWLALQHFERLSNRVYGKQ